MATIVQPYNPYNPWRKNLVVGLLGPIINNLLQNSQQTTKNAKMAAIMGEANRMNDAPAVSSGLGGDAWQYSQFNNSDAGFGTAGSLVQNTGGMIGNSGLMQYSNGYDQWQQARNNAVDYGTPAVNNGLSLAKIAQVYGSDPQRFKSVSLDELTKAVNPYIEEANAARRRSAVDAVFQNPNMTPEERVLAIANLVSNGDMARDVFDSVMPQIHITPYQQAGIDYNNAKMAQEYELERAKMAQNQNQWQENFNENQRQFNVRQDYTERRAAEDDRRYNNPPRVTVVDVDGNTYTRDPRSSTVELMTDQDGNPIKQEHAPQKKEVSKIDEMRLKDILKRRQGIREALDRINLDLQDIKRHDPQREEYLRQKSALEEELWLNQWLENGMYIKYATDPNDIANLKTMQNALLWEAEKKGFGVPNQPDLVRNEEAKAAAQSNTKQTNRPTPAPVTPPANNNTTAQQASQVQPSNVSQDLTKAVLNSPDVPPTGRVVMPEVPPTVSKDIDQRLNGNTGVGGTNPFSALMPNNQQPPQTTPATQPTAQMSNDELAAIGAKAMGSLGKNTPKAITVGDLYALMKEIKMGKTKVGVPINNVQDLERVLGQLGYRIIR